MISGKFVRFYHLRFTPMAISPLIPTCLDREQLVVKETKENSKEKDTQQLLLIEDVNCIE